MAALRSNLVPLKWLIITIEVIIITSPSIMMMTTVIIGMMKEEEAVDISIITLGGHHRPSEGS